MALHAHMIVKGSDGNQIEGSCDQKGREKTILVEQFDHEVYMPSDPHTGLPVGNVVHKLFTVCKIFDKSTPKLYKALATGERFPEVEVNWYRIKPDGKQELYFKHKLEDAIIVSLKPYMKNRRDKDNDQFEHMEEVSFTYRKVTWTWEPDGIAAESDWRAPAA